MRGGHRCRPAFGDEDTVGTDDLGRSDDGAQVAGIGDVVERDDKRVLFAIGPREHGIEGRERVRLGVSDDSLMRPTFALGIQHALGNPFDRHARLLCPTSDLVERAVGLRTLGDEHSLEWHVRPQRLDDRVAPLDLGHRVSSAA